MWVYLWKERLPSAYQEVDWIQSSGWQYIDTWYTPSSSPDIDITFEFIWGNSGQRVPIYWRRYPWVNPNAKIALFINSDSCYISPNYATFDPWTWWWVTISKDTKYNMVNNVWQFYINGVLKTGLSTTTTLSEYGTWTLYLFDTNDNYWTVLNRWTQIKLYSCKLYNSWTLIRDLIPCYRKSDWVIWLYDAVDWWFYTNLWTGTFSKWADVTMAELKNAYIWQYTV
jgi:hypothetical protein